MRYLMFDDIETFAITYSRKNHIYTKDRRPEFVATHERKEKLVINRETETIDYEVDISKDFQMKNKYHIGGKYGVSFLLEKICRMCRGLSKYGTLAENHSDFFGDITYTIEIKPKLGEKKTLGGHFNQLDLPKAYPKIMQLIKKYIDNYTFGEIFDSDLYSTVRPDEEEYILVKLDTSVFGDKYYLCSLPEVKVGDLLSVYYFTDKKGEEQLMSVEVLEVSTCKRENLPALLKELEYAVSIYSREDNMEYEIYEGSSILFSKHVCEVCGNITEKWGTCKVCNYHHDFEKGSANIMDVNEAKKAYKKGKQVY